MIKPFSKLYLSLFWFEFKMRNQKYFHTKLFSQKILFKKMKTKPKNKKILFFLVSSPFKTKTLRSFLLIEMIDLKTRNRIMVWKYPYLISSNKLKSFLFSENVFWSFGNYDKMFPVFCWIFREKCFYFLLECHFWGSICSRTCQTCSVNFFFSFSANMMIFYQIH